MVFLPSDTIKSYVEDLAAMFHSSLALIFDNNKLFVSGNLNDHLGLNVGTRAFS